MIPNIILMFPAQSSVLTKIAQIIMHSFRDSKIRNKGFLDCLFKHENYETEKQAKKLNLTSKKDNDFSVAGIGSPPP
jgi:hypothetical protein